MDLDRKEDKKYAYPIIDKIKSSKYRGFAMLTINDTGNCEGMVWFQIMRQQSTKLKYLDMIYLIKRKNMIKI